MSGGVSKKLRLEILVRDGFTCQDCGIEDDSGRILHVGHIVPALYGKLKGLPKGKKSELNEPDNLKCQCANCNELQRRADMLFMAQLKQQMR